jgi:hypothetical protein
VPDPISLLVGLLPRVIGPALRRFAIDDSTRIRLGVATPYVAEADLDWAQLRIQNPGSRWNPRSAGRATVHALIDGKRYDLMWSTPQGPRDLLDLPARGEAVVSVAIRNCSEAEKRYSIPADARPRFARLAPWACHVTDINFHTQQDSTRTLISGRHLVHAVVTYDGGSVSRNFVLNVPQQPLRPVALTEN